MSVFFKRQPKIAFGSQEEVTAYWKREGAHRLSREQIEDMLRLMIDDVTFRITTDFFAGRLGAALGGRLLDAGCGWGRSLFGLKRRFPDLRVTGVDVTPELLDLGRQLMEKLGVSGVEWKEGNLLKLDFPDGSFDGVISTRVLHYILEPAAAVRELVRVTRPGGRLVVMVPNRWNPLLRLRYHTRVYSPRDLAGWFRSAGARVIESGSVGFIPPFRFLRKFSGLALIDRALRRIPLVRGAGGLAVCVAEKSA